MRALIEEVVGAVAVTEVVQLPWLVRWASASKGILVDKNLNGSDVSGEVARILVGLCQLRRRDFCVVTGLIRENCGQATPAIRRG